MEHFSGYPGPPAGGENQFYYQLEGPPMSSCAFSDSDFGDLPDPSADTQTPALSVNYNFSGTGFPTQCSVGDPQKAVLLGLGALPPQPQPQLLPPGLGREAGPGLAFGGSLTGLGAFPTGLSRSHPTTSCPPAGYFGASATFQPQTLQQIPIPAAMPAMAYNPPNQLPTSDLARSAGFKSTASSSPEPSESISAQPRESRPHRRGYQACQRCRERKVKCDLGSK